MKLLSGSCSTDRKRSLGWTVLVLVLLVLIINPEIRALLIVIDLIGFDLYLLLCLAQLRDYGPVALLAGAAVATHIATLLWRLGSAAGHGGQLYIPSEGAWLAVGAMLTACLAAVYALIRRTHAIPI